MNGSFSMRSRSAWLCALVLAAPALPSGDLFTLRRYPVTRVAGRVLAWTPQATGWSLVQPESQLMETSLIQVRDGASLTLGLPDAPGIRRMEGNQVEVTLDKPIVVRLSDDILRHVAVSTFFIPDLPEGGTSGEAALPGVQKLSDAWDKIAAMLAKAGVNPDWVMEAQRRQAGASLSVKAKRIEVIMPADNTTLFTEKLPLEIRTAWHLIPGKDPLYAVRVWRKDDPRPAPLAVTRQAFHHILFKAEGLHYVQISTPDDKFQSGIQRVFVVLPVNERMASQRPAYVLANLKLDLPPPAFAYYVKAFPTTIHFSWENPTRLAPGQKFFLTITDTRGRILARNGTSQQSMALKFAKPGRYQWSVQAIITDDVQNKKLRPSETRTFSLALANTGDPLAQLVTGGSAIIYLETGI